MVRNLIRMFPVAGQEQTRAFNRLHSTVQLLLGTTSGSLHSRDGGKAGDLRLNRTVFHPGWVLTEESQVKTNLLT